MSALLGTLIDRRRWVIALFAVLAAAMAPGLTRIQQDNSPEVFFVRDAVALEHYRDLEFHFGRDRLLRVVLSGEGVWTPRGLAWIGRLESGLGELFGIVGGAGLYGHHRWRFDRWPPVDLDAFQREVAVDPLDLNAGWIGSDGSTVTVLVGFYKLPAAKQRRALAGLDTLLNSAPPDIDITLAGVPALNQAMDDALTDMATRFFPPLVLVAVLLLALCLRRVVHVLMPFVVVAVCQLVVFGAMGYAGVNLNLVTIIFAPLTFVIALATAVHVLLCFREISAPGTGAREAVLETYRLKAWPVIWTGVTTALGFGSLAVSPVPPVQALGAWTAAAIAFATVALLTLYPALLACASTARPATASRDFDHMGSRRGRIWARWAVRHRTATGIIFGLSALALATGIAQLGIETNLRTYFDPDHPLQHSLAQLEQADIGAVAADLVLVRPDSDPRSFDQPEELARLAALTAELRTIAPLKGAIGTADLVDGIGRYRQSLATDDSRQAALDELAADSEREPMLRFFLAREAKRTRIAMFVPLLGYTQLEPAFERARAIAVRDFPDAEVQLTGQYPLVLSAQRTLLKTMLGSLAITVAGIALVLRGVLGSFQLTWRAMLANLWPVAFALGVMGWAGIPVDSTTVMIAAVALGLAVDDTLHSLGYFRALLGRLDPETAAVATLQRTAPAHLLTTLVLAVGFGMLAFSAFVPVARFGALTALALLAALVADLLLVPALLAAAPKWALEKLTRPARPAAGG